jgi:UDP-N-acetylmuramoyl-tripeptide--D-alanyl-D-alanine ligase
MRRILQKILRILARIALNKYKPIIIGVTGSVGKTSTKEAIYSVLKSHFGEKRVRRNYRNYNNELGVPLTIFNTETGGRSVLKWIPKFIKIFWMIIFRVSYCDFLVLEMGADKPNDIEYLLSFVKHKVGVVTAMGEIPVHVEFFDNPEEIAAEKEKLVRYLDKEGIAILNYDDERVKKMGEKIDAKVITYGLNEKADVKATNYELKIDNNENLSELNFKLDFKGSSVPAKLINVLGVQHLYSALAAAAVGIIFNMNLIEISEAIKKIQPMPGRMHLLKGIKDTLIIDDSYNAALLSMEAALESLRVFSERRKVLVLGDMLEIGQYSEEAHRRVGKKAAAIADLIFAVGNWAGLVNEAAIDAGFDANKIFQFFSSDEAKLKVQEELKQGDVILVKGSRAMKMEKIIEEIVAQ